MRLSPDRARYVGASEVASLFGESPYQTLRELYEIKAGHVPAPELDREYVQAGVYLESGIAQWATVKWNWPLVKPELHTKHPTLEGMAASLDYITTDDVSEPVDCKVVDEWVWKKQWLDVDGNVDPPLHVQLQINHQIAVLSPRPVQGWLIVLVGGRRLERIAIPRRDAVIAEIERRVTAFWQSIEDDRPPPADYASDGPLLARLYGQDDGSTVDLSGSNRLHEVCTTYRQAGEAEKKAAAVKAAARAELLDLIGPAKKVTCGPFRINAGTVAEREVPAHVRQAYRNIRVSGSVE